VRLADESNAVIGQYRRNVGLIQKRKQTLAAQFFHLSRLRERTPSEATAGEGTCGSGGGRLSRHPKALGANARTSG
jgi:hypothetical protein